jgi:hypothetical protein
MSKIKPFFGTLHFPNSFAISILCHEYSDCQGPILGAALVMQTKGASMKTLIISALLISSQAFAAKVFFESPKDGATVKSPFTVKFGVEGMKIQPAGEDLKSTTTGHHHLIVDGAATPKGEVVPADATHLHFGKGQTSTELTLAPGPHTLTLQFADGAHKSYGPEMSQTIKITVAK